MRAHREIKAAVFKSNSNFFRYDRTLHLDVTKSHMTALEQISAQDFDVMETTMATIYWASLSIGFAFSADLLRAVYHDWHMRRVAIKCERTLTAKYALSPRRRRTV